MIYGYVRVITKEQSIESQKMLLLYRLELVEIYC